MHWKYYRHLSPWDLSPWPWELRSTARHFPIFVNLSLKNPNLELPHTSTYTILFCLLYYFEGSIYFGVVFAWLVINLTYAVTDIAITFNLVWFRQLTGQHNSLMNLTNFSWNIPLIETDRAPWIMMDHAFMVMDMSLSKRRKLKRVSRVESTIIDQIVNS